LLGEGEREFYLGSTGKDEGNSVRRREKGSNETTKGSKIIGDNFPVEGKAAKKTKPKNWSGKILLRKKGNTEPSKT